MSKYSNEYFRQKVEEVHQGRVKTDETCIYNGCFAQVRVICPEHKYFDIVASKLLNGRGCQKCGRQRTINSKQLNNEKFIKKARAIHGDKFDYSKVDY